MTPARSSTSWKDKERLDLPTIIGPDGQDYVTDLLRVEFRASRKRSFPGHGCEEFSNILGVQQIRFAKGNLKAHYNQIRHVLEREGIIK